jgi:uncharacterized membrane protein
MSDMTPPPVPPAPPMPPMPPAASPTPPMAGRAPASGRPAPASDTSRLLAALGYPIWIVALIAVLIDPYKDEKFVKFHAIQALGFAVGVVVLWIAFTIVSIILTLIPYVGAIISSLLWFVLSIGALVVAIVWAIKAYNGEYAELPFVYGIVKSYFGE